MKDQGERHALQVDWIDSKSWVGWQNRDYWKEHLKKETCAIISLEFLLYEDDSYLCLAQSWGTENAADVIQIPKKCITGRKEIKLKD